MTTRSDRYFAQFRNVLSSKRSVVCSGCGVSLKGDDPTAMIECWNCFEGGP